MSRIGFLVTLPEHVERFDPVRRRIPGSRLVLAPGRWPGEVDSHRLVARALTASRSPIPREEPGADLDLLLTHGEVPPARLRAWLSPEGILASWVGPGGRPGPGPNFRAVADPTRPGDLVVGDPRLDCGRQGAARSRGRTGLGLAASTRPLVAVVRDGGWTPAWDEAVARLRTELDLAVLRTSRDRLGRRAWPRGLTGPGIVDGGVVAYADLLAAADLCVSDAPTAVLDARSLGTRTLRIVDGVAVPGELDAPGPHVWQPGDVAAAVPDALQEPSPTDGSPGDAADRLAAHLRAIYSGSGVGSR